MSLSSDDIFVKWWCLCLVISLTSHDVCVKWYLCQVISLTSHDVCVKWYLYQVISLTSHDVCVKWYLCQVISLTSHDVCVKWWYLYQVMISLSSDDIFIKWWCLCQVMISLSRWISINSKYIMPFWCNGYHHKKWTWQPEFKSWTKQVELILLEKVWIHLLFFQQWVNSKAVWGL